MFNVKKKHDVGPYISSGYKMILSEEQHKLASKMKAEEEELTATKEK